MYLKSVILGALVGAAGTALGGVLAVLTGRRAGLPRQLMGFAGGVMTAVVIVDMLPSSAQIGGIITMCAGAAGGGIFMGLLSPLIRRDTGMAHVGYLVLIGIALHNLPEGLAVGSSLVHSTPFALSLALLMLLHNIPEGLAVCLPLRLSGMSVPKMLLLSLLTGLPTAAGALIGTAVGYISESMIAACLSFAGGAMLYISLKELIPASNDIHISGGGGTKKAAFPALLGVSVGIILGALVSTS